MFSKQANRLAKKKRHSSLKDIEIISKKTSFINSNSERSFFLRVIAISTSLFVLSFVLPTVFITEADFWVPPTIASEDLTTTTPFAEEGFFIKPEIQTEHGNRENINEVIEVEVENGDTISALAERYGISSQTILQNNNIYNANKLKNGQLLTILPVDGLLHEIKKGETVASIAKKYKIEGDKIITQNKLGEDAVLEKGAKLIIPGAKKYVAPPVKKTTVYATAPSNSQGQDFGGTLFFPCQGRYTQYYHYGHYAVDIAQRGGSPIWAAESGTVIKAQGGWNGGYGNMIIIDHGNGMKTLYGHQKEIYVNVGQKVVRGQAIGYMGNTGRVYGPTGIHLHFEVIVNGGKQNPQAYF